MDSLAIGEDLQVPVSLQLSQPQQQNYETPSGAMKLGYDLGCLVSRSLNHKKRLTNINIRLFVIAAADCNYIDAPTGDVCFLIAIRKMVSDLY